MPESLVTDESSVESPRQSWGQDDLTKEERVSKAKMAADARWAAKREADRAKTFFECFPDVGPSVDPDQDFFWCYNYLDRLVRERKDGFVDIHWEWVAGPKPPSMGCEHWASVRARDPKAYQAEISKYLQGRTTTGEDRDLSRREKKRIEDMERILEILSDG